MIVEVIKVLLTFGVTTFGSAEESTLLNVIQEGKREHYELGRFTRRRYQDFLPEKYSREDFIVWTTNTDRTYMSASCHLAGLFPPVGEQVWHKDIPWQPIPIFPSELATMNPLFVGCNRYSTLHKKVWSTEEHYVQIDRENQELYEYLTENSGTNITSLFDAFLIFDALHIEDRQKHVLPEWTKAVYPEPLSSLANELVKSFSFTDEQKRLSTGPFLYFVIRQFEAYLADPSSAHKYLQFSAHDFNIASILNTLGAFEPPLVPNFASTIYIELREQNGTNLINVYYKNYDGPEQIIIKGCDFNCNLQDFKSIVDNFAISPEEWYQICETEVTD
ncbi:hypothetical protein NQ318_021531 [Aromia moschata]|uniref:acid phosphatase n=1 Tax=Aromia moschata TaxID=1265417 RepID=A0AAV8ZCP5_9CUCU|nr:hypothetical protein NQ318_021531 [Aromia moschata]